MIKVNIICGALGSGKTTLAKQLLEHKPATEFWGILVNEFGSVGIDGAILNQAETVLVAQMPGGCICCSAKGELYQSLIALKTDHPNLDRLIIEPTGLGEPDSLVDIFKDPALAQAFEIQTLFSVFDVSRTEIDELKSMTIMQSLLSMADVIVFNKKDLANEQQIATLTDYCNSLYPPKQAVITTQHSQIPQQYLNLAHCFISGFRAHTAAPLMGKRHNAQPATIITQLPYEPLPLPGLITRAYKHQLDIASIGWIFKPEVVFNWTEVKNLFETFQKSPRLVKRGKGVFRAGAPWMLFQYVDGQVTREYLAYRLDSRLELLIEQPGIFDFVGFEQALLNCIKST